MYLFLLGRDFKLSKLELIIYLKTLNIKYSIISDHEKYILINFFQKINLNKVITDLGGITRISKIFHKSEKIDSNFINYLDLDTPKKFNYSVSSIDIDDKEIESVLVILKDYYKSIKSKAVYKKPRKFKSERLTIVNPDNYFSWKLDNGFELFVIKEKNIYYFGKTVASSSSKENRFKDTNRPFRKNLHTTSFRLARIMVNLLGLEKNKTILDPFCGTGTFLIEALIRNYNVIGVDKNNEMADISLKNLNWAQKQFNFNNTYKVITGNSTKIKFKADACVSEPFMGPFLDNLPNTFRAQKIVSNLSVLYSDLFENLNLNLKKNAIVVFVLPEFRTFDNKIVNVSENVFFKNNFKKLDVSLLDGDIKLENPIFYTAPNGSKINRYIYILKRN